PAPGYTKSRPKLEPPGRLNPGVTQEKVTPLPFSPGPSGLHARTRSPPCASSKRQWRGWVSPLRRTPRSWGLAGTQWLWGLRAACCWTGIPRTRRPGSTKRATACSPPGTPPASPQRRPRKQPNPCRSTEKLDPGFEGVTLKFQIKPDSSLQIIPTYSLPCSSRSQESPADAVEGPAAHPRGTEAHSAGSEALEPRRCASCQTQRTPLWRDAEDGTPLCNACGIRSLEWRRELRWGSPNQSMCNQCGVRGKQKSKHLPLGKSGFLVAVSGPPLHPKWQFLVPQP
uniref:GATA-type domain-containing protein n=1 Tax=Piliocolobus tephrosceles TaxID=591936 RepID=A0A8C9ILQ3_9PRIM